MPNPTPTPAQVRELLAQRKGATPGKWTMTCPRMGFADIIDENGDLIFSIAYPSLGLGDKARPEEEVEANAALLIPVPPGLLESWLRMHEALERAKVLLDATARFLDEHPVKEYEVFYDEADCDGYCLMEDCRIALDDARAALAGEAQEENHG